MSCARLPRDPLRTDTLPAAVAQELAGHAASGGEQAVEPAGLKEGGTRVGTAAHDGGLQGLVNEVVGTEQTRSCMGVVAGLHGYPAARTLEPRNLECGGKRSATPLWELRPVSESGVGAPLCRRSPYLCRPCVELHGLQRGGGATRPQKADRMIRGQKNGVPVYLSVPHISVSRSSVRFPLGHKGPPPGERAGALVAHVTHLTHLTDVTRSAS
jgi:hypothetical protein